MSFYRPVAEEHVSFKERRIVSVHIPESVLRAMFAPTDLRIMQRLRCESLPDDAELVRLLHAPQRAGLTAWFTHESFEPVSEGDYPPELHNLALHSYRNDSHEIIAGAIFDFAGYLTSLKQGYKVGAKHDAAPMVKLIEAWAEQRGLDLSNADVQTWALALSNFKS